MCDVCLCIVCIVDGYVASGAVCSNCIITTRCDGILYRMPQLTHIHTHTHTTYACARARVFVRMGISNETLLVER